MLVTSPKQDKSFLESTHRFNIWVGSVRAGKTYSSIRRFIDELKHGPGDQAMIVGVNRAAIDRNVLKLMYDLLGFPIPSPKVMKVKLYGKTVYFVGAPDVGAVATIKGSTLGQAYVDEITEIPENFWLMLESRLSVSGAKLFGTTNPDGPSHWLKKNYIDRAEEIDLISWNFTLDDNPTLDEEYKKRLKASYQGLWYKRYILGEWALAQGAIYDQYDRFNEYNCETATPTYYIMGIDYGTTNATAAVMCAISPGCYPQMRVESEYYWDSAVKGRSKSDAELVEDIKDFIGYKNVSAIYVDPAAASLKIALRHEDLPVIDANNDVLLGIKTVNKFVSGKNIVIHESCKMLREQMQSYAWCKKSADRGEDKPVKKEDHACVIGSTQVCTENGLQTIESLVGKEGKLYSYCIQRDMLEEDKFYNVTMTGKNVEIWEIKLESGEILNATSDHQVLTKMGWKQIKELKEGEEIYSVNTNYITEENFIVKNRDIGIPHLNLK